MAQGISPQELAELLSYLPTLQIPSPAPNSPLFPTLNLELTSPTPLIQHLEHQTNTTIPFVKRGASGETEQGKQWNWKVLMGWWVWECEFGLGYWGRKCGSEIQNAGEGKTVQHSGGDEDLKFLRGVDEKVKELERRVRGAREWLEEEVTPRQGSPVRQDREQQQQQQQQQRQQEQRQEEDKGNQSRTPSLSETEGGNDHAYTDDLGNPRDSWPPAIDEESEEEQGPATRGGSGSPARYFDVGYDSSDASEAEEEEGDRRVHLHQYEDEQREEWTETVPTPPSNLQNRQNQPQQQHEGEEEEEEDPESSLGARYVTVRKRAGEQEERLQIASPSYLNRQHPSSDDARHDEREDVTLPQPKQKQGHSSDPVDADELYDRLDEYASRTPESTGAFMASRVYKSSPSHSVASEPQQDELTTPQPHEHQEEHYEHEHHHEQDHSSHTPPDRTQLKSSSSPDRGARCETEEESTFDLRHFQSSIMASNSLLFGPGPLDSSSPAVVKVERRTEVVVDRGYPEGRGSPVGRKIEASYQSSSPPGRRETENERTSSKSKEPEIGTPQQLSSHTSSDGSEPPSPSPPPKRPSPSQKQQEAQQAQQAQHQPYINQAVGPSSSLTPQNEHLKIHTPSPLLPREAWVTSGAPPTDEPISSNESSPDNSFGDETDIWCAPTPVPAKAPATPRAPPPQQQSNLPAALRAFIPKQSSPLKDYCYKPSSSDPSMGSEGRPSSSRYDPQEDMRSGHTGYDFDEYEEEEENPQEGSGSGRGGARPAYDFSSSTSARTGSKLTGLEDHIQALDFDEEVPPERISSSFVDGDTAELERSLERSLGLVKESVQREMEGDEYEDEIEWREREMMRLGAPSRREKYEGDSEEEVSSEREYQEREERPVYDFSEDEHHHDESGDEHDIVLASGSGPAEPVEQEVEEHTKELHHDSSEEEEFENEDYSRSIPEQPVDGEGTTGFFETAIEFEATAMPSSPESRVQTLPSTPTEHPSHPSSPTHQHSNIPSTPPAPAPLPKGIRTSLIPPHSSPLRHRESSPTSLPHLSSPVRRSETRLPLARNSSPPRLEHPTPFQTPRADPADRTIGFPTPIPHLSYKPSPSSASLIHSQVLQTSSSSSSEPLPHPRSSSSPRPDQHPEPDLDPHSDSDPEPTHPISSSSPPPHPNPSPNRKSLSLSQDLLYHHRRESSFNPAEREHSLNLDTMDLTGILGDATGESVGGGGRNDRIRRRVKRELAFVQERGLSDDEGDTGGVSEGGDTGGVGGSSRG